LKVNLDGTRQRLDIISRMFWSLTKYILHEYADFDDKLLSFSLHNTPIEAVQIGEYHLISKDPQSKNIPGDFLYRLSHPLGEYVIHTGRELSTPVAEVVFDISNHPARVSLIEQLKGKAGYLILQHLRIDSFETEDHLLFSGFTEDGESLDQETCAKLFVCDGKVISGPVSLSAAESPLNADAERHILATINRSLEENSRHFNEAREQLEKWAEDMELAAQKELVDMKNQINAMNRQARQAATVQEQHDIQEKIRQLEQKKRRLRQKIFDIEDEIIIKRDQLIDGLEKRMQQKTQTTPLYTIQWRVE
jgi:hypothetical protein